MILLHKHTRSCFTLVSHFINITVIYLIFSKTHERIHECYYGIRQKDVAVIINQCKICLLNAPAKTKPTITPIVSHGCCHRLQLDLMDMRLNPDGEYKWILQIKCHFSRYVWLSALKDKGSEGVAIVFSIWLAFNGLCRIVQCDNGTEFKGALRQKCQEYGIKMIRGRSYYPETQDSVERANGTYKQCLRAYIRKGG
jgi:hypothetical protein